jgi:hypothetical protein|eukprot:COSAG01_NODE_526_length_15908_cov_6.178063_14_plen_41_part_00
MEAEAKAMAADDSRNPTGIVPLARKAGSLRRRVDVWHPVT